MNRDRRSKRQTAVLGTLRAVDFITAILILTGQITATGVFLAAPGFWLSFTGPVFGGKRVRGVEEGATILLDAIDVISALLLILGQVRVTGPWISSGGFSLPVTGPAFGVTSVPLPHDTKEVNKEFSSDLRGVVIRKFAPEMQFESSL